MGKGKINIIGCGRAAGSLSRLWVEANSWHRGRDQPLLAESLNAQPPGLGQVAPLQTFPTWVPLITG